MLETHAIIVRLDGTEAIVESTQSGGCGLCNSVNGCGSGKLSGLFCARPRQFRVPNGIGAQVGDEVQVSVADGALFRSALIVYLFPLSMLFAGALLGSVLAGAYNQDICAAIGALAGLSAGFVFVRLFALRQRLAVSSLSAVIMSCRNRPVNSGS
jgi:sigma-E factor negative regulatory protein RseC